MALSACTLVDFWPTRFAGTLLTVLHIYPRRECHGNFGPAKILIRGTTIPGKFWSTRGIGDQIFQDQNSLSFLAVFQATLEVAGCEDSSCTKFCLAQLYQLVAPLILIRYKLVRVLVPPLCFSACSVTPERAHLLYKG